MKSKSVTKAVATAVATLVALIGFSAPSQATGPAWVANLSWSNLHVVSEEGVFENFHRDYVNHLYTGGIDYANADQHNAAYVRLGHNSVTLSYHSGLVANRNKEVRFLVAVYNGDESLAYSTSVPSGYGTLFSDKSPITDPNQTVVDSVIVTTNSTGDARLTITPTATPTEGVVVVAGINATNDVISGTEHSVASEVGTMLIGWHAAGFRPITKLVGSATGRRAVCGNTVIVGTPSPYMCHNFDFKDQTFDWKVADNHDRPGCKDCREWFVGDPSYDYTQAYAKSYAAGSTMSLIYHVADIWGTPVVGKTVHIAIAGAKTKWSMYSASPITNSNGDVTFTSKNINSVADVTANIDVNPDDTRIKTKGAMGFVVTTGVDDLDQSSDLMWFSVVPNLTIVGGPEPTKAGNHSAQMVMSDQSAQAAVTSASGDGSALTYVTDSSVSFQVGDLVKVSGLTPSSFNVTGAVVTSVGDGTFSVAGTANVSATGSSAKASKTMGTATTPLVTDPDGTTVADTFSTAFNIDFMKNATGQPLNAPDVVVTATNGGRTAIATAEEKADHFSTFANSVQFKDRLVFGFTYFQDLVFMGTRAGVTTWTISVGAWSTTISKTYVLPDGSPFQYLRYTNRNAESQIVLSGALNPIATFSVVDSQGAGYPDFVVVVTHSIAGQSPTTFNTVTDSNGQVAVALIDPNVGAVDEVITVAALDSTGTQLTPENSSASTTIHWGYKVPAKTVAPKIAGTAKVAKVLSAAKGTWTGTPTATYVYSWYSCTKRATAAVAVTAAVPATCKLLSGTTGATKTSLKLTAAHKAKFIRVMITATNAAGVTKWMSASTVAVAK